MNEFIISCCSTADLSREVLKENNIEYTCFHYNIDGKDCLDDLGETMPISEFYKKNGFVLKDEKKRYFEWNG